MMELLGLEELKSGLQLVSWCGCGPQKGGRETFKWVAEELDEC